MAIQGSAAELLDSLAASIEGTSPTATFQSEWITPPNAEWFGLALALGTCTGTSTTLDVTVECRFGGGANIYPYPADQGSIDGTPIAQAALDTLTDASDDVNVLQYWKNILPSTGRAGEIRFNFAIAGTTPVFPIQEVSVLFAEWRPND